MKLLAILKGKILFIHRLKITKGRHQYKEERGNKLLAQKKKILKIKGVKWKK